MKLTAYGLNAHLEATGPKRQRGGIDAGHAVAVISPPSGASQTRTSGSYIQQTAIWRTGTRSRGAHTRAMKVPTSASARPNTAQTTRMARATTIQSLKLIR